MGDTLSKQAQAYLTMIRHLKEELDPLEVLHFIANNYLDSHYPLQGCVLCPHDSMTYTVGDLIEDTLNHRGGGA